MSIRTTSRQAYDDLDRSGRLGQQQQTIHPVMVPRTQGELF